MTDQTDHNASPALPAPMPIAEAPVVGALQWIVLISLVLSIGGNVYLWHGWRQDQTVAQVMAQPSQEVQVLRVQVQELQALQGQVQELQALRIQAQELQRLKTMIERWNGDLEALRKVGESSRMEMETLKAEIKRLQESRVAYEAFVQKQLQAYQEQSLKSMQSQKRHEVNW